MGYAADDRIFKVENANRTKGTGTRVEINGGFTKKSAGPNPKVSLSFQGYNSNAEAGSKITDNIPIFLELWEAAVLAKDILSGRIGQLGSAEKKRAFREATEEAKAAGKVYCNSVWQSHLAGTPAEVLKKRGKSRPDGKSISRVMKIVPATKPDADGSMRWVLQAQLGAGEDIGNGLIKPSYTRPDMQVRVALSSAQLKEMACALEWLVGAYMLDRYNSWSDGFEPVPQIDDDGVIIEEE